MFGECCLIKAKARKREKVRKSESLREKEREV